MITEFTVEQLINAIHETETLKELRELVGPTKAMQDDAVRRDRFKERIAEQTTSMRGTLNT